MPAASTASGASPTARSRRPKRVLITTQCTSGNRQQRRIDDQIVATDQVGVDRSGDRHVCCSRPRPGHMIGMKRASGGSAGVWPPCRNHAMPNTMVSPAARILIATPLTTWLPRWVMQAKPCSSASTWAIRIPAASPTTAEPLTEAAAAAGERGCEHLAFEPDVDQPATLAKQRAERAQDQRRRERATSRTGSTP